MFRKLNKNRKGQNTAEYALLIALVVAAIIAMQTYAQRALQARVRDASLFMVNGTSELGTTNQYEPYYLVSNYAVDRRSNETVRQDTGLVGQEETTNRIRQNGGFQASSYNGLPGGI